MKYTFFLTALCLVLQSSALQKIKTNSTISIINEDLYIYVFSCATNQLVALSANQKSLLFYDVEKQPPSSASLLPGDTLSLPMPGELLQVSEDGHYVAVSHDSYLTVVKKVNNSHVSWTYLTSIIKSSSMIIIEGLACLFATSEDWNNNIICLNMEDGNMTTCSSNIDESSWAFTNLAKGWVYVGTDPQSMQKYKVSKNKQCLEYIHGNPELGSKYDYTHYLWFSYDGSRIFLDNGLTLTSSDDTSDMKPHGDFNSSYETFQYSYFSQSPNYPYNIAGIRSDINHTIYQYSWPYLQPLGAESIPHPPQGEINGAEQVHVCAHGQTDSIFIIARYALTGKGVKIGIVKNFSTL